MHRLFDLFSTMGPRREHFLPEHCLYLRAHKTSAASSVHYPIALEHILNGRYKLNIRSLKGNKHSRACTNYFPKI